MELLPETQAILRQFPWGRLEKDGSFSFDIARARLDVLGAAGYGYWSHRGGLAAHVNQGDPRIAPVDSFADGLLKKHAFVDGLELLKPAHLTDEEGWKLPARLVPYLDFAHPEAKRPIAVTDLPERVGHWKAWYAWRRLPLARAQPLS
jgi:hypothetical protein